MFFTDLLFFSNVISSDKFDLIHNFRIDNEIVNVQNIINISKDINYNKIGIIDFRYILKRSNAMKILANKFLLDVWAVPISFGHTRIYTAILFFISAANSNR